MRNIFFALLFFTFSCSLSAQEFIIKVRVGGELTPLVYVLQNDKPVALTDEKGQVTIEKSTLKYGDRLTGSYIGAKTEVIIYSEELARAGTCTIELTPEFAMDEVVVTSEITGWDIFKKYTNIPMVYEKRHDIKLDFNYQCNIAGEQERNISGTILLNKESSVMTQWNHDIYEQNLLIQTRDDTTGIKRQLLTDLFFTLQVANGAVFRVGQETFRDPDSRQFRSFDGRILFSFQHKGIENNERLFLVTNDAYEFGSSRPLRYLFRVNTKNKNIASSESIHLLPKSLYNRRTSATYEMFRLRWLKPESAELESVNPDTGTSYYLTLNNIKYNTLTRRERKLLYPKEIYQKEKDAAKQIKRSERQKNRERQEYYRRF